jgi:hypothetical protein
MKPFSILGIPACFRFVCMVENGHLAGKMLIAIEEFGCKFFTSTKLIYFVDFVS